MSNADNTEQTAKKEIRRGPKIVGRIIIIVVIVTGALLGITRTIDVLKYTSTDDASIKGENANISAKMLGRISSIAVHEGEKVQAGQLLVELDATDLKAQEVQARASLEYARKNLELARINLDKTQSDYDRISRLYKNNAATKENYDHAGSGLNAARAQYSLAEAQVNTSAAQIGVLEAQIKNTTVTSPIQGTVNKISLSAGDVVQPGLTIMTINNLEDVWIQANIKETKIDKVKLGAEVRIKIDAFPGRKFSGEVEMIQAGIVPPAFQIGEFTKTTQRIPVKIKITGGDIPEGGLQLLPGMSAVIKIRTPFRLGGSPSAGN